MERVFYSMPDKWQRMRRAAVGQLERVVLEAIVVLLPQGGAQEHIRGTVQPATRTRVLSLHAHVTQTVYTFRFMILIRMLIMRNRLLIPARLKRHINYQLQRILGLLSIHQPTMLVE